MINCSISGLDKNYRNSENKKKSSVLERAGFTKQKQNESDPEET